MLSKKKKITKYHILYDPIIWNVQSIYRDRMLSNGCLGVKKLGGNGRDC